MAVAERKKERKKGGVRLNERVHDGGLKSWVS
jgi:hypothetical protein